MYYIIDSTTKQIIADFQDIDCAVEYVIHHTLDKMVFKNDFVTLGVSPNLWLVEFPIGYIKDDNLLQSIHIYLKRIHSLTHLVEYNNTYQKNKKIYNQWLDQINRIRHGPGLLGMMK